MTSVTGPQAREMTPEEVEQRAAECYQLDQQVKMALRSSYGSRWDLAEALWKFDEATAWSGLGYEKLSHWLADPEVGMTTGTFYRYRDCWRFVVRYELPPQDFRQLDTSKVAIVIDAVQSHDVSLDDALADVEALGARDLRKKYGGQPDESPTVGDSGSPDVGIPAADLSEALAQAHEALDIPQREAGARQAVRQALVRLVELLETSG